MSSLSELKTLMVKSTMCEIDMVERGHIACADQMLMIRHTAYIRMFIMGCLESQYATYKDIVDYCFEEVKEMIILLISKKF